MALYNNVPTFSYIHATGISVVWNEELYMVQDFSTNLRYVYWNADLPNQLNASNIMPNRSNKQYLVLINDNGIATEVPPTTDDFNIYFDGNSTQAIKDRIFGLHEKNENFGDKFVAIEQDIDTIKQIIGSSEEGSNGDFIEKISKIEQTVEEIDLLVKETSKTYNDDKETNKLREDLNSAIIKLNSTLGTFKGELTDYFKNNEITSEEEIKIEANLEILVNEKTVLDGLVDTVRLVAEKNNQTQDVVAIESAKQALQIAHDNLYNNISNAIIDSIITPTENTIIIDGFAKYNLRINELKQTCDDIILLGLGGVIVEELANINIKSDEIKLSVSKVESDFKNDMSVQKIEIENQISDISNALSYFEETVNTTFKDGLIDETEKQLLQEKIDLIDKEKVDVDLKYSSIIEDINLSQEINIELTNKYDEYCTRHNELKEKISNVISDNMVNDAEKLEVNTLFKLYSNALAYFSALMNKAIEDISFNTSKAELEQAKKELQNEINDVRVNIEEISGVIDGTFEDNILDEVERKDIQQNLEILSREKIDIDNTFNNLYNNKYLDEDNKNAFKVVYDDYINAYNEVINVSNDILDKETLIDNVDRANLNSSILGHKDKLNLFSIEANRVMDIISFNQSNSLKNDIHKDISDVNDRIDDVIDNIDVTLSDSIIDKSEILIIKESLEVIQKEKLDIDARYLVLYENSYLDGDIKNSFIESKDNFDLAVFELVDVITSSIEDEKITDDELILISEKRNSYKDSSASLSSKFQEIIDYLTKVQIDDAKLNFNKEIEDLNGIIVDLQTTMNGVFQDGILTEAEKLSIKQHLLTLSSEKSDIDKQYFTMIENKYLENDIKSNLTNSYNDYVLAYNSLISVINNILNKEGLISESDRNNLNNAFSEHDRKLGIYTENATNSLDFISSKKAEVESEKVDKKYAEIILDPEEGILSKVNHVNSQINGDGGISERLQTAEEKITEEGITQIVESSQYIKDLNGKVTANANNISIIDQKASSIELSVKGKVDSSTIISAINMSSESIKINASKVNITGFVTFSDLSNSGYSTINGSNITTGTINANLAKIININASNITTGTLSGNRISGGIIEGSLLRTYEGNDSKGVRIAKESMQLNNASFFYETNDEFRIQCKERFSVGSMNDIYLMARLNSDGTQSGSGEVVVPNATLRTQRLHVVNNANIYGSLAVSSSLSSNTLSTTGAITASGTITGSSIKSNSSISASSATISGSISASSASISGNVSANALYAYGSNIRLSYDSSTYVPSAGTYASYNLFLGSRKIFAPPNSSLKALFVVNEYGTTGYINAHLATNTYSLDVLDVQEASDNSVLDNTIVQKTSKGKCILPLTQQIDDTEDIETVLKRDCAVVKDGVIYNDITSMVYALWEEVQILKNK